MAVLGELAMLFDWKTSQFDLQPDITIAAVFMQRYGVRVSQLYMWEAWCEPRGPGVSFPGKLTLGSHETALLGGAMLPLDDWPCIWCGQDYGSPSMVLSDWCNYCYYRNCTA